MKIRAYWKVGVGNSLGFREEICEKCFIPYHATFCLPPLLFVPHSSFDQVGSFIIDSPFLFPTRGSQKSGGGDIFRYISRESGFSGSFFLQTYIFRVMVFFLNFYEKTPLIFFWLVYLKYIFLGFKICFLQPISNN